MRYQDFVIEAGRLQADGTFHIDVPRSPAGGLNEAVIAAYDERVKSLDGEHVDTSLVEQLEELNQRFVMSQGELIELGQALAAMLFPGDVEDMLRESLGLVEIQGEGLRLRLDLQDPRLACLPWEYVYWQRVGDDPSLSGFLALNARVSIVRYMRMRGPGPRLDTPVSRLNVLAVFAEPEGLGTVKMEEKRRNLEEAFKGEEGIALQIEDSLTRHELQDAMQRGQYDIFSFSGHGAFATRETVEDFEQGLLHTEQAAGDQAESPPPAAPQVEQAVAASQDDFLSFLSGVNTQVNQAGEGDAPAVEQAAVPSEPAALQDDFLSFLSGVNTQVDQAGAGAGAATTETEKRRLGQLLLETEDGKRDYIRGDELALHLSRGGVRAVVLDGCESAMRDAEHFWNGLAPALVRERIPAVVAMQYGFTITAAVAFWRAFYRALAAGMSLERAVSEARLGISGLPFDTDDDTGNPFTCRWDFGFPVLYMQAETPEGIVFPRSTAGADGTDPARDLVSPAVIAALPHRDQPDVQAAYGALKDLLAQKYPDLAKPLDKLEAKPGSSARQKIFGKEVVEAGAHADADIAEAAEALAEALEAQTGERPAGVHVQQTVTGDKNIVAGTGDVTLGDVNFGG